LLPEDSPMTPESALNALNLLIPDRCPHWNAAGTVKLQETIQGPAVLLNWHEELKRLVPTR